MCIVQANLIASVFKGKIQIPGRKLQSADEVSGHYEPFTNTRMHVYSNCRVNWSLSWTVTQAALSQTKPAVATSTGVCTQAQIVGEEAVHSALNFNRKVNALH